MPGGAGGEAAAATARKVGRAMARTAMAVTWREAERAAVQAEAAARLPWRAAIAHARQAKRAARRVGRC